MIEVPPIYREAGRTYVADMSDSLRPLAQAMERAQIRVQALVSGDYPGRKLPRGVLPGVKTVGFWDAEHTQDWGLDWHRNEGVELMFLETGLLPFAIDGHEVVLKPGDLPIARPWQRHRLGNPHVTAGRLHTLILDVEVRRPNQAWKWPSWLVLSKGDLKQLTDVLRHNEQPVWHASEELQRCFQRIGRLIDSVPSGEGISWLTLQLNELFLRLLEMCRSSKVPLDESLSSSARTVDLFLSDLSADLDQLAQPWTLPRMAKQCGLGITRFVHFCKQMTNQTPLQYLNRCRLQATARLLTDEPQRSITDVALCCGFSSSQYYATVFGRHFGCSPSEFREKSLSP